MKRIQFLLLALVILVSSGCATVAMLKDPPKVKFKTVKLKDTDLKTALLNVILEVENKNAVAATVDRLRYSLAVDGKEIAQGLYDEKVTLPANEIIQVAVPVSVKLEDIFSSAFAMLQNKGAPYFVKGSVGVGVFDIPFDATGKIELDKK